MIKYLRTSITRRLSVLYELSTSRVTSVEGLRGFAMTLVFFGHFEVLFRDYILPQSRPSWVFDFVATSAHRGVSFFLVITGCFIYGTFLDRPQPYWPFVRKRIGRIYPVFLSVLTLYLLLSPFFPFASKLPDTGWSTFILIVQNVFLLGGLFDITPIMVVSWTLTYLVLFYLIVPPMIVSVRMSRWQAWQRVSFLLGVAVLWLEICRWLPGLSTRAVMFVPGMLIYELSRSVLCRNLIGRWSEVTAIALLAAGFGLVYLLSRQMLGFLPGVVYFYRYYFYGFLSLGFFLFCFCCFAYDGLVKRLLSQLPLRCIGKMSYSYYLVHGLTLQAIHLALSSFLPSTVGSSVLFWCVLPVAYLATLGTAAVFFFAVERRIASYLPVLGSRLTRANDRALSVDLHKKGECAVASAAAIPQRALPTKGA